MSKTSKIMIAWVACGLMVTSARAEFTINANPLGLDLRAVSEYSLAAWPEWDTDELELAYDNGQLDVSAPATGILFGSADALVNGVAESTEFILWNAWTATFAFTESYTGPRALGAEPSFGHALRIGITANEAYNNYQLEVYYQTTDEPGVYKTLFSVEDLAPPAYQATVIYVVADAVSAAVENIDKLFIKSFVVPQNDTVTNQAAYGAGFTEFNVSLAPGLFLDAKTLFPDTADSGWTGTATTNVDWTVGSYVKISAANNLSVTALGYVDHDDDGLSDSHSVGIYDADQVLIASATVDAGTVAPLTNGWRYVSLSSPVELMAGATYLMVGDTGDGTDRFRYVPATDDDEPIPATGSGVFVPDVDGIVSNGYAGVSVAGDLTRVYATSGGALLTYPTEVRDGVWNAVNMQYDLLPVSATIVGSSITNDMVRLVIDAPSAGESYPKTTDDLAGGTWGSVAHSDDGINQFHITNLTYSTLEDGNRVIYVDATNSQSFFGIGGE